jgi:hypothetical protein
VIHPWPHPLRAQSSHPAIAAAFKDYRRAFWSVVLFSSLVNMRMLAGPLYVPQVYDRVLASYSVATLIALSILLCFCTWQRSRRHCDPWKLGHRRATSSFGAPPP